MNPRNSLHRIGYYLNGGLSELYPGSLRRADLPRKLDLETDPDADYILRRVAYYNRLPAADNTLTGKHEDPRIETATAGRFHTAGSSVYYFDLAPLVRHFPRDSRFCFIPGDVSYVPELPTLVKSRPIGADSRNSVLMKLNVVRHYYHEPDPFPLRAKKPLAVWRGAASKPARKAFLADHFDTPFCDAGAVGKPDSPYRKPYMSIREQCRYKYIVSIEGNDVATNLKWIFRSNSVCLMRRPRNETWFMEGGLEPDVHYVELKDDFSDLEERIDYCESNPSFVQDIIHNANNHARQFDDRRREEKISLLVLKKYFEASDQPCGHLTRPGTAGQGIWSST